MGVGRLDRRAAAAVRANCLPWEYVRHIPRYTYYAHCIVLYRRPRRSFGFSRGVTGEREGEKEGRENGYYILRLSSSAHSRILRHLRTELGWQAGRLMNSSKTAGARNESCALNEASQPAVQIARQLGEERYTWAEN